MIMWEMFPFPINNADKSSYDEIVSEIRVITVEGFLWPRIGQSVSSIPGMDKCQGVQYGTKQYIPAPLGATVGKDVLSDDILLKHRTLGADMDDSTRIITTT